MVPAPVLCIYGIEVWLRFNQFSDLMLCEPQRLFKELAVGLENELNHCCRILDHRLGYRWRQIARRAHGFEAVDFVRSVAEWFILRMPAPAQRNYLAPA